jgi:hypothetical protein
LRRMTSMLYIQVNPYDIPEKYLALAWWTLIIIWSGYHIWKGFIEEVRYQWREKHVRTRPK